MSRLRLLILSALILLAAQGYSSQINKNNWVSHPRIKEIRSIVQIVDKEKEMGFLNCKEIVYEDRGAFVEICRDEAGIIRYEKEMGSEGGVGWERTTYFDKKGVKRFYFNTVTENDGQDDFLVDEQRNYFNKKGKIIFEIDKSDP